MSARPGGLTRELMAMRAALEVGPGDVVNLGIGIPTLVSSFVPAGRGVILQSESGLAGYGEVLDASVPFDPDQVNASGQMVELPPGAACFDSALAFAMIRGGHVDVTMLGGLQVSADGDLANWFLPARGGGSVGGAMDLAVGAKRVVVLMEHTTPSGEPRLLQHCTFPLTARGVVRRVITDLAVVDVTPRGFALVELAPGVRESTVRALTAAPLAAAAPVGEMTFFADDPSR